MKDTSPEPSTISPHQERPHVILSAGNINHYHHTAVALQQAGYLSKYLCVFEGNRDLKRIRPLLPENYRKRLAGKALPGLNHQRIMTYPWPYLVTQGIAKLGLISTAQRNAWFSRWYDRATVPAIKDAEVFHFVNSMGLLAAQRARQQGMTLICDVRVAHIDEEDKILRREHAALNIPYRSSRMLYRERIVAEYQIADAIIVPSEFVKRTMEEHGISTDKIYIVPYGVDIGRFAQLNDIRRSNPLPKHKEKFRALYVGSVIPRKGVHYLIQAWEKLQLPKSELIIVGSTPDKQYHDYLEGLVKHTQIRWVGHIPQIYLWQIYQQANIFVLPTLAEGSALVNYEAMAASLPVVTTPNGGSIIQDGFSGWIVPIRDVDALTEKLQWAYEHPEELAIMGNHAQQTVQQYTWAHYRRRLLNTYEKILQRKS